MTASRLLLVDDDPDLAVALRVLCRRAGWTYGHGADAETAWRMLTEGRPDLILLDVNLPGTSGIELLRRVRASDELSRLPVALFCQGGLYRDVAAGWAAGASYLVAKELVAQAEAFGRRITAVLAHAGGQSAAPTVDLTLTGECHWTNLFRRTVRRLAPAVLAAVLVPPVVARAFREVFGPEVAGRCLSADGDKVIGFPRSCSPEQVQQMFDSLGDQCWALFGDDARTAYLTALRDERAR